MCVERESLEYNTTRLHEAAFCGSLDTLNALIQAGQQILGRIFPTSSTETPLQVAGLSGHLNPAKKFSSINLVGLRRWMHANAWHLIWPRQTALSL